MAASGTVLAANEGRNAAGRVLALDALRGVAVAGIVPMNVIAFSMPAAAYVNPGAYGGTSGLDAALWALSFVFVEDKFRALFAMLFGAGVAILLSRDTPRPLTSHYARMAALMLIAMLHAVLLANNDVLRSYAIAGVVLPLVVRWPVRWLLWAAGAIMAAQLAVSLWFAWPWLQVWWEGTNRDALAQANGAFGPDPQVIAASIAQWQESFGDRVARRMTDIPLQLRATLSALPSGGAAMLIGIALWRSGLLAGEWEKASAFRLARNCAVVTLPVLVAMAIWGWASGFSPIVTAANALVLSAPFDLLLGLGYAALAMALFGGAWRGGKWTTRWAAAGRMALTNYLATSLIFAGLFAAWGLGLFGTVSRTQALALGLIPMAAMLVWSPLWLARFRQGPAECAWRPCPAWSCR